MTMLFMSPLVLLCYNNNNSYNNNYKKKDNINNIACIHIITVSEMLFLLSSSCSALSCLYLKRNLILKHKLVISKHKLVILTQLSLCLKRAEWEITEKF